jgi:hypothetical protein
VNGSTNSSISLRLVSTLLACVSIIGTLIVVQSLQEAKAQAGLTSSSKPRLVKTLYIFSWPNGYSEVDSEDGMISGIVSNIDFGIVGSELCIDASEATYCFAVSRISVTRRAVTALQSYGLVDKGGFDLSWPRQLPTLPGPAAYSVAIDQRLPAPTNSVRHAYDLLHQYYQAHRLELAAAALARAAATPSPTPRPPSDPPVSFIRVEYPSPSPGRH